MGWMKWIVIAVVVYSAWMYVYAMGARTAETPAAAKTKEAFVGMGVDQAEDFEAEERFETKRAAAAAAEDGKKKAAADTDKDMQTIFEDLSQATETINAIMKRFKEKLYPSAKESFAATAAADAHEADAESGDEAPVPVKKKTTAAASAKKKKAVVAEPVAEEEQFEDPLPEEFEAPPAVSVPEEATDAESFSAPRRVTAPVTRFRRVETFTNAPAPASRHMRARYVQAPYSGVQSSAFYDSMEWIPEDRD